jgi:hypothetical protein
MTDDQRRTRGDENPDDAGRREQSGPPADRQAPRAPRDRQARPGADR